MWLFDPHRDRIKRRRQPWKLHQNLWQKNNISTNNHITTTKRILTVGPAAGLTCFCPAHDSSLSGSLLSSVPGWLMYGLGKWREAALDKCLQIQWLSWTPRVFWFVSLDDRTTVPDQITSCTELFQDRAGWRESGLTYTHQWGADPPTAVLDTLFSSPTIPVFTALDATDGAEICG